MSVKMISEVLTHSRSKGNARLVAIALADVANNEGEVTAYKRSWAVLAGKANCARSVVPVAIAKLCELGELIVLDSGGGRGSASYRLDPSGAAPQGVLHAVGEVSAVSGAEEVSTPLQRPSGGSNERGPRSGPEGSGIRTGGVLDPDRRGPESGPPSLRPSPSRIRPSPSNTRHAAFDAFWAQYPRRIGKATARKAYDAAVGRANAEAILHGALRLNIHVHRMGLAIKYVPHPSTWLNRDGWDDELEDENAPRLPVGADTTKRTLDRMKKEGR